MPNLAVFLVGVVVKDKICTKPNKSWTDCWKQLATSRSLATCSTDTFLDRASGCSRQGGSKPTRQVCSAQQQGISGCGLGGLRCRREQRSEHGEMKRRDND